MNKEEIIISSLVYSRFKLFIFDVVSIVYKCAQQFKERQGKLKNKLAIWSSQASTIQSKAYLLWSEKVTIFSMKQDLKFKTILTHKNVAAFLYLKL